MNTTERVTKIVNEVNRGEDHHVAPGSSLKQLGLDSLDFVDTVMSIEEEFDIEIGDDDLGTADDPFDTTIEKIVALVDERVAAKRTNGQ